MGGVELNNNGWLGDGPMLVRRDVWEFLHRARWPLESDPPGNGGIVECESGGGTDPVAIGDERRLDPEDE